MSESRLGAPDLLKEILAAHEILSATNWAEPGTGSPRVRHQRISALTRAFELGTVDDLVHGRFLAAPISPGRQRIVDEAAAKAELDRRPWPVAPPMFFSALLHYRSDVYRVVHATRGTLECGEPLMAGLFVTQNHIGKQIDALMGDIDRWLCALMAPEGHTFELRDLIAHHGWPDVDLRQVLWEEF